MVKKILVLISLIIGSANATADSNEPFDFNYQINGKNNRPVAVFNDGKETFIQVSGNPKLLLSSVSQSDIMIRGPYYVVKGVPAKIMGTSDGESFSINWEGALNNPISDEAGRINSDFTERSFSGSYGRIAFLNGFPKEVGLVNPVPQNLSLKDVLKTIAPHGWSGLADRSINTNQNISFNSKVGESWVVVLDRVLNQLNVWVEIDTNKSSLYLRDAPPKGFSLVLENQTQPRKVMDVTVGDMASSNDYKPLPMNITIIDQSLRDVNLAKIGRRDDKLVLTIIDKKKLMRFTNLQTGMPITPTLVNDGLTYEIADTGNTLVEVMNGEKIEIRLNKKFTAQFNKQNALELLEVTHDQFGTKFKFSKQQPNLKITTIGNEVITGNWVASTYSVTTHQKAWNVLIPTNALRVDMNDNSNYLWRKYP